MSLRAKSIEEALALVRAGKAGSVDVVDDKGNVRMQVVIPRAWKSTARCKSCGEPLYCDVCK